ncbi:MAG: FAD-binding oxidoreductase [Spirochaetales bacterium]|nr:FAD-binding oxidoreductase [Spirochaetales bacterium]
MRGKAEILESYSDYLTDESRKEGICPGTLYLPETTEEVCAALREIEKKNEKVTISGARTGITGGAVPASPNLISLSGLKPRITVQLAPEEQYWTARVGAGTTLEELNEALRTRDFDSDGISPANLFYPVDPTETGASVGGMAAANASGARTLKYGPTRDWIAGLTIALVDGSWVHLRRDEIRCLDGYFKIVDSKGRSRNVEIGDVKWPSTKHTAGYPLKAGMDALDLFIGGDGTLGVITEIDLILTEIPKARLCLVLFAPTDDPVEIVTRLLKLRPAALEYMDENSLSLLRDARNQKLGGIPEIPIEAKTAIYLEFEADSEETIDGVYEELAPLLAEAEISEELTWAGFDQSDIDAMKAFRHALPERINSIIAGRKRDIPRLTKVGTDMAVPQQHLGMMLSLYIETLNRMKLEYCIFGHIGNAHLHVNILPRSLEEQETGYRLYHEFAYKAVELGGSVSAEHGIGRLKLQFMSIQYSSEDITRMSNVKHAFDPDLRLNPGVLLDFQS